MKWIDLPPIWLIGFLALAWAQAQYLSLGLSFGAWGGLLGLVLLSVAICLAVAAIVQFRRHRTTVIPHMQPSQLITTGIFGRSRNPIYLADILILTAFVLMWDAVPSLALIPIFTGLLQKRFIYAEELRLKQAFPDAFTEYCRSTRRWI